MQQRPIGVPKAVETQSTESLRYSAARAALTSGGAEMVTRVLTIGLSIVTARLLEPIEVGLLGLAVIIVGVVSMLASYPETAAVTARAQEPDHQYALAATEVRAAIVVCLLAIIWFALPAAAHILMGRDTVALPLRELLGVLVWLPVLELASGYPQVVMQRRLQLNSLARIQLLQPVIFVGLAVALLLTGHGYFGVAWASVVSAAVTALILWSRLLWFREMKFEGWPSKVIRSEIWRGTAKVFVGGFGGYLGGRLDNLLVSASIGPAAMSFYSMAWNASRIPANVFSKAISFVLVPAIARIQDDPARVQRALRECIRNSYLLLAPACALLFVNAPLLVTYVIGAKWLPLVPALRVMCFTVLAAPILFSAAALLVGTGRAHLPGLATAIQLAALAIAIPPLSKRWGVLGASYADLIAVIILTLALWITAWIATRQLSWSVIRTGVLPMVAAVCSAGLGWFALDWIDSVPFRIAISTAATAGGYVLILGLFGGRAGLINLTSLVLSIIRRLPIPAQSQT